MWLEGLATARLIKHHLKTGDSSLAICAYVTIFCKCVEKKGVGQVQFPKHIHNFTKWKPSNQKRRASTISLMRIRLLAHSGEQNLFQPLCSLLTDISRMELFAFFISLMVSPPLLLSSPYLLKVNFSLALNYRGDLLKRQTEPRGRRNHPGVRTSAPPLECTAQGQARLPVFSAGGDFVIGGIFSIHHYKQTVERDYAAMPEPERCGGRLVKIHQKICFIVYPFIHSFTCAWRWDCFNVV